MSEDSPVDPSFAELLDTDLTGESTVGLVKDVLGGDTNLLIGDFAGKEEVKGGRRDDNLGGGVQGGGVEVLDDGGSALGITVPEIESLAIPACYVKV